MNGIVSIPARRPVDEIVASLVEILRAKQVKLFALIDHSGEAEAAGLRMRPIKLLVWEDADGKAWVSYNDSSYLQARHGLAPDLVKNIAIVADLAAKAAE